jgi:phage-related minor tail protein
MGEAGPEAIMPLKRDGQGNLGVRTTQQQPKVDVVVNNFSGEKAETMETVDSKGNRKIEVVIGEMVASEVGRKNSPMQQSISANFMTRPAMTRR